MRPIVPQDMDQAWRIATAVYNREADGARIDGTRARNELRRLNQVMDDLIEAMREVMQSFQRGIQRASDTGAQVASTRSMMLGNLRPA